MSIDVKRHQMLVDTEGEKTGVLIPFSDYQYFLAIIERERQLEELNTSMSRALCEMEEIKAGKRPRVPLESFLDEL